MVIPSPLEEHLGQIWDPKDAKEEIENAYHILAEFIEDMNQGRVPKSNIKQIAEATDILGLYAGYPAEAADMEGYIKSELAVSYQEIVKILQGFVAEMKELIDARLRYAETKKVNPNDGADDVPF